MRTNSRSKIDKFNITAEYQKLLIPDNCTTEKFIDGGFSSILNQNFIDSFPRADKRNIFSKEFEQTVDMYHTGFNKCKAVNGRKIIFGCIFLTCKISMKNRYMTIIKAIKSLMECYFGIQVVINTKIKIKIKKKEKVGYVLYDGKSKIEYKLRYNAKKNNFSVFSFLDVFPNFVPQEALSFIAFTDVNLYENSSDNEIFGRVLNLDDNYAIVSLNNERDSESMITTLHETMHTFGFSHCMYWDCIMNAKGDVGGYSPIRLCPMDMIKLKLFNPNLDFMKRFKMLKNEFNKLGWNDDEKEVEEKLKLIG